MRLIARLLDRVGTRLRHAAYLLENPAYAGVRRSGGARDLFRLLNQPWVAARPVELVIDVGANEGQFLVVAAALFPRARHVAFEPHPEMARRLRERFPGVETHACACGAQPGTAPLHLSKFAPASSLLRSTATQVELYPGTETERTVDIPVVTLDSFAQLGAVPSLLKLDVQGYELAVLQGATALLARVQIVVCEVSLKTFYDGQAQLEDLVALLRGHGLMLVDVAEPLRAPSGEIAYFDLAFAREDARS
jgi:FkbM family methyltransferase